MKTELYQAIFVEDEYKFSPLPNDGSIPNEYRSNGYTYTPNEISYDDSKYLIYCNHELNDYEKKKLELDWTNCPYSPK